MTTKELGEINHKHNLHGALRFSQFFNLLRIENEQGLSWIDQDDIPKLEKIIQEFKERVGLQHFSNTTIAGGRN